MSNQISWDHEFSPELGRAWGNLARLDKWRWWITFTFQRPVSKQCAMDTFKRWAQGLAKKLREHLTLFWAMDNNGGHLHFHFLLQLPAHSGGKTFLFKSWLSANPGVTGHVGVIQAYDPERGAAYYIGGKIQADRPHGHDVVCSRRPCCRRKSGCRVSPSAW